ncbi:unnamed protein product [Closterium sp. NIES-65]|nr:unnamed protein product [Closterium sp. NIES-65]
MLRATGATRFVPGVLPTNRLPAALKPSELASAARQNLSMSVSATLNDLQSSLNGQVASIDAALKGRLGQLGARLNDNAAAANAALQLQISALKAGLAALSGSLANVNLVLFANVSTAAAAAAGLDSQVSAIKANISSIRSSVDALNKDLAVLAGLSAGFSSIRAAGKPTSLQQRLSQRISAVTQRVAGINANVSSLAGKVNALLLQVTINGALNGALNGTVTDVTTALNETVTTALSNLLNNSALNGVISGALNGLLSGSISSLADVLPQQAGMLRGVLLSCNGPLSLQAGAANIEILKIGSDYLVAYYLYASGIAQAPASQAIYKGNACSVSDSTVVLNLPGTWQLMSAASWSLTNAVMVSAADVAELVGSLQAEACALAEPAHESAGVARGGRKASACAAVAGGDGGGCSATTMDCLDDACLLLVFSFLAPLPDRFHAGRVCRRWQHLAADRRMWIHVDPLRFSRRFSAPRHHLRRSLDSALSPHPLRASLPSAFPPLPPPRATPPAHAQSLPPPLRGEADDEVDDMLPRVFPSLALAVRAARPGDTILLAAGAVHAVESVVVDKPLCLRGAGMTCGDTVLESPKWAESALDFSASALLINVTVRSGYGHCVLHRQGRLVVERCAIECAAHPLAHLFFPILSSATCHPGSHAHALAQKEIQQQQLQQQKEGERLGEGGVEGGMAVAVANRKRRRVGGECEGENGGVCGGDMQRVVWDMQSCGAGRVGDAGHATAATESNTSLGAPSSAAATAATEEAAAAEPPSRALPVAALCGGLRGKGGKAAGVRVVETSIVGGGSAVHTCGGMALKEVRVLYARASLVFCFVIDCIELKSVGKREEEEESREGGERGEWPSVRLPHPNSPPLSPSLPPLSLTSFPPPFSHASRVSSHELFFSYFKELIGKEVTVELKNDLAISGTLHSVDQYLNIKLHNSRVVNDAKYPHMLSVKNCFIRGSVVRYVLLPPDGVDVDILHDATRREARGAT